MALPVSHSVDTEISVQGDDRPAGGDGKRDVEGDSWMDEVRGAGTQGDA